jgi:hypothetical protein
LWLAPCVTTLVLLAFAAAAAVDARVPAPWLVVSVLGVVLAWFSYLSIPRRVTIDGADVVLDRPIGSVSLPISEIHGIDARAWNRRFVTVHTRRRRVFLLRNMPDLATVILEIIH